MKNIKVVFVLFLVAFIVGFTFSEEQIKNRDIFLIVDKSLSMEDKIEVVKSYINTELIPAAEFKSGDTFTLISFYGNADKVLAYEEFQEGKLDEFIQKINHISADGRFTDIGNALDELGKILEGKEDTDRIRKFILITDGKQEAPPESKYYSTDGKFNHAFLDGMNVIKKQGWQVMYISIGSESDTESLLDESGGTYYEMSEDATLEDYKEKIKTEEFLNISIEIVGDPWINPIPKNGRSLLNFKIKCLSEKLAGSVTIESIKLKSLDNEQKNILTKTQYVHIEPNEEKQVEIPVKIDLELESGKHEGELTFIYPGGIGFKPSVVDVNFRVKGFLENNIWIVPLAIILLLLLAGLVVIFLLTLGKSTGFKILIEGVELNKNTFRLKHGSMIYIADSEKGFDLIPRKNARSFASIFSYKKGIRLKPIDKNRFENPDKLPGNMLNKECMVRKINGTLKKMQFIG